MAALGAWAARNNAVLVTLDLATFALETAIAGLQMLSTGLGGWHDELECPGPAIPCSNISAIYSSMVIFNVKDVALCPY